MDQMHKPQRPPVAGFHTPSPKPAACETIRAGLAAFKDGSLRKTNGALYGTIRAHVESCASCKGALDALGA